MISLSIVNGIKLTKGGYIEVKALPDDADRIPSVF